MGHERHNTGLSECDVVSGTINHVRHTLQQVLCILRVHALFHQRILYEIEKHKELEPSLEELVSLAVFYTL